MVWLPMVKKCRRYLFVLAQFRNVTDGRTDRQTPHTDTGRAYASHRAAKTRRSSTGMRLFINFRYKPWWLTLSKALNRSNPLGNVYIKFGTVTIRFHDSYNIVLGSDGYLYILNNFVVYREPRVIGPFECAVYARKRAIGQHPCIDVARFQLPVLVLSPEDESFYCCSSLSTELLCAGS